MPTYYATFGFNQSLRNNYVKIEAEDSEDARAKLILNHGRLWAFIYPEERFDSAIARYDLVEVPLGTPNIKEYSDD